jgi:hypothetical protein
MKRFAEKTKACGMTVGIAAAIVVSLPAGLSFLGCNVKVNKNDDGKCTPVCSQTNECRDDGCGGTCLCANSPDEVCNAEGECVPESSCGGEVCGDRECGSVCGVACGDLDGDCPKDKVCNAGYCDCSPSCDDVHCAVDDGCGGTCGCPSGKACDAESGLCIDSGACDGKVCGTWDGEACGVCPDGLLCNADGQCVTECNDLCSDVGWECDEAICHDDCGDCPENEECVNHICVCKPSCEAGSCSDGCGGTCDCEKGTKCDTASGKCVDCTEEDTCGDMECGQVCGYSCGDNEGECGENENCVSGYCYPSTLKMTLVSSAVSESDGRVHGTLQVDYKPRPGEPSPRMADLRLMTDRAVNFELESVTLGGSATTAHKSMYEDPITMMPWQYRPDGAIQMLIHTADADLAYASETLREGVLLSLNFVLDLEEDDTGTSIYENKVEISLVRRDQVFAPFDADNALQETAYDQAVVVTK